MKEKFRQAISQRRQNGQTRIPLLLDELLIRADSVAKADVLPFLSAAFSIADELNIEEDSDGSMIRNRTRLHWLVRRLTLERMSLPERSTILLGACQHSALGWMIDIISSAVGEYRPREGKNGKPQQKCLMTPSDVEIGRMLALRKIEEAAADGSLELSGDLASIMYRWRDLADDGGIAVRAWSTRKLDNDFVVSMFAQAFTSYSTHQSLGFGELSDRVAERRVRAQVEGMETIMDVAKFRAALEKLESDAEFDKVKRDKITLYLNAWRSQEREDGNPKFVENKAV